MALLSEWRKPCDNEDLNNKHQAYLALSDRYDDLDKNLFEAQQNKYILKSSDKNKVNKPLKGTKFDASSIDRSMRDQTRNIVCHAHHVSFEKNNDSFLVLRTSGCLSKRVVLIFITRLSTCFTRVDFSSARVGIFFTRLTSSVTRVSLAARTA